MLIRSLAVSTAALTLFALSTTANAIAVTYDGVEFPQGDSSFADLVVDFTLGGGGVTEPHQNPLNALGAPDYDGVSNCSNHTSPAADCTFVSLGAGGSLTLGFTTNALTGSGDDSDDLWIFEVGPLVEPTAVEISADGVLWHDVGSVGGATAGINIDAFGFGPEDLFHFVRLTDICSGGACTGRTAGADIDAVGAISTVLVTPDPTPVPTPAPLTLLLGGLVAMGLWRRRFSNR